MKDYAEPSSKEEADSQELGRGSVFEDNAWNLGGSFFKHYDDMQKNPLSYVRSGAKEGEHKTYAEMMRDPEVSSLRKALNKGLHKSREVYENDVAPNVRKAY